MCSQGRKSPGPVVIRAGFEPTRVAAACLAEAYACLLPIRRRAVRTARPVDVAARTGRPRREGSGAR